ncbi:hypothetical protein AYI68_g2826 [Smittium mucronatum]|uniref:Uncharacterized protein n=1 Tax=Smittium mucronatum TaxID=133383 RepID=A0A1R0H1N2_9FUNG|nr:hypothetical protein AYI68_g2826 [Smittium mucronatum]
MVASQADDSQFQTESPSLRSPETVDLIKEEINFKKIDNIKVASKLRPINLDHLPIKSRRSFNPLNKSTSNNSSLRGRCMSGSLASSSSSSSLNTKAKKPASDRYRIDLLSIIPHAKPTSKRYSADSYLPKAIQPNFSTIFRRSATPSNIPSSETPNPKLDTNLLFPAETNLLPLSDDNILSSFPTPNLITLSVSDPGTITVSEAYPAETRKSPRHIFRQFPELKIKNLDIQDYRIVKKKGKGPNSSSKNSPFVSPKSLSCITVKSTPSVNIHEHSPHSIMSANADDTSYITLPLRLRSSSFPAKSLSTSSCDTSEKSASRSNSMSAHTYSQERSHKNLSVKPSYSVTPCDQEVDNDLIHKTIPNFANRETFSSHNSAATQIDTELESNVSSSIVNSKDFENELKADSFFKDRKDEGLTGCEEKLTRSQSWRSLSKNVKNAMDYGLKSFSSNTFVLDDKRSRLNYIDIDDCENSESSSDIDESDMPEITVVKKVMGFMERSQFNEQSQQAHLKFINKQLDHDVTMALENIERNKYQNQDFIPKKDLAANQLVEIQERLDRMDKENISIQSQRVEILPKKEKEIFLSRIAGKLNSINEMESKTISGDFSTPNSYTEDNRSSVSSPSSQSKSPDFYSRFKKISSKSRLFNSKKSPFSSELYNPLKSISCDNLNRTADKKSSIPNLKEDSSTINEVSGPYLEVKSPRQLKPYKSVEKLTLSGSKAVANSKKNSVSIYDEDSSESEDGSSKLKTKNRRKHTFQRQRAVHPLVKTVNSIDFCLGKMNSNNGKFNDQRAVLKKKSFVP